MRLLGEGDCDVFAFDEGVEGEVGGPVDCGVEGAAVGGEAEFAMMKYKEARVSFTLLRVAERKVGNRAVSRFQRDFGM